MTPPDADLEKQKRRHRGPLVGIAIVAAFGVGLIVLWVIEVVLTAPDSVDTSEDISPADIREGDVEVPEFAPTETVEPGDPEVEVVR